MQVILVLFKLSVAVLKQALCFVLQCPIFRLVIVPNHSPAFFVSVLSYVLPLFMCSCVAYLTFSVFFSECAFVQSRKTKAGKQKHNCLRLVELKVPCFEVGNI